MNTLQSTLNFTLSEAASQEVKQKIVLDWSNHTYGC